MKSREVLEPRKRHQHHAAQSLWRRNTPRSGWVIRLATSGRFTSSAGALKSGAADLRRASPSASVAAKLGQSHLELSTAWIRELIKNAETGEKLLQQQDLQNYSGKMTNN